MVRRIVEWDVFLDFFVLLGVGLGLPDGKRYCDLSGILGMVELIVGTEILVFLYATEEEMLRPFPTAR